MILVMITRICFIDRCLWSLVCHQSHDYSVVTGSQCSTKLSHRHRRNWTLMELWGQHQDKSFFTMYTDQAQAGKANKPNKTGLLASHFGEAVPKQELWYKYAPHKKLSWSQPGGRAGSTTWILQLNMDSARNWFPVVRSLDSSRTSTEVSPNIKGKRRSPGSLHQCRHRAAMAERHSTAQLERAPVQLKWLKSHAHASKTTHTHIHALNILTHTFTVNK